MKTNNISKLIKVAKKRLLYVKGEIMRNIKLIIEYDGKEFNGWQKQPKTTGLNIF